MLPGHSDDESDESEKIEASELFESLEPVLLSADGAFDESPALPALLPEC